MSDFFTSKLPNVPKINSVKEILQSVFFHQWSITEFTQIKLSKN